MRKGGWHWLVNGQMKLDTAKDIKCEFIVEKEEQIMSWSLKEAVNVSLILPQQGPSTRLIIWWWLDPFKSA